MRRIHVPDLDLESLAHAVDAGSYARGADYMRRGHVTQTWWDDSDESLNGVVRGSNGHVYVTAAYFRNAGRRVEFESGECSCPVGRDCKHVVALVLHARGASAGAHGSLAGNHLAAPHEQPTWEQSLDAVCGSGPAGALASWVPQAPVAVELSLAPTAQRAYLTRSYRDAPRQPTAAPGEPTVKLSARLVQPGKRGGWIAGKLSWSRLDLLGYSGEHPQAQVRLLQQIYAVHRARASGYSRYYSYGDEKSLDLCGFESGQLWPLLDEANALGVRLVYPGDHGEVEWRGQAEFCLDVTARRPDGGLVIVPVLRIEGTAADLVPIAFIGSEAHGVVCADRAAARIAGEPGANLAAVPFRLARLARPIPQELQRMALAGQRIEVPADATATFRDAWYPRLRRAAAVVSTDGSFTPPEISGPTLLLRAGYRPGHRLDLDWLWAYRVGDTTMTAELRADLTAAEAAGYRDPEAERAVLAGLDLPLDRFGLTMGTPGFLDGIDTMRFSTELLPLLADAPGVAVEITGEQADYREVSDSLRIAVSTDEVPGDQDWFDLGVDITVDGKRVPFLDVFVALSRGHTHLLLDDGAYFSLDKPELRSLARLIDEARELIDAPPGQLKINRFQAGLWEELAELGVVSHQAKAWQDQVAGLLAVHAIEPPPPPAALRAQLRPYQLDGYGWLAFLWRHRLGGILADDMGLGKTVQSLALICHARQDDPGLAPFLVVAPTSVVPNWCAEAARFAPGLKVVAVTQTQAKRGERLSDLVADAAVVVTSYTLLRLDYPAYAALTWSGLILDEAQFAKNHQAKTYQCARKLPAPVKLAITGTPMENNLMELWSLLSITAPGLFPNPQKFSDHYVGPIERRGDADLLAQLRRRIKPLVKRRTKEQVAADLPPKQEQVVEVELHPRHRKIYQTHLQRERQKVLGLLDDMNTNRFIILRSLTLLRQLSLHAGLVEAAHADLPSSKLDLLVEQLGDVIGSGHRALVFSQFTGFLAKVRERLDAEGVPYCYLDGSTTRRAEVLARFKTGPDPVFLISLKAGGFGINLTEADYCFVLDPWWNPATEAQAVDRTHRIGQTRTVMVYRLIAADTIEQKVMALKERKARLFASVMDDGNMFGSSLSADDIRELFA
jgi:superfamily II DNA or RNA helicase